MFLYTTVLLIQNQPVRYEVSTKEKSNLIIFKPERFHRRKADLPSFWIIRKNGEWTPLNIKDMQLRNQLVEDIGRYLN